LRPDETFFLARGDVVQKDPDARRGLTTRHEDQI
jgi:hypothetical protein